MLCDKCLNKSICKYYDFLVHAPMVLNIESCEKAKFPAEQPIFVNPNDNIALLNNFKQPIDYSQFNIPQEEEEIDENEEKITVNLSECTEPKYNSMLDILIGDDNDVDKKEN
jgi:hypothetical protein